jgi:hypothetical protein
VYFLPPLEEPYDVNHAYTRSIQTGTGLEAIHTMVMVFLLSPHRTRPLHRMEFLHPPGRSATAKVLRTTIPGRRVICTKQFTFWWNFPSWSSKPNTAFERICSRGRSVFSLSLSVWRYSVWGSATVPAICADGNFLVKNAGREEISGQDTELQD